VVTETGEIDLSKVEIPAEIVAEVEGEGAVAKKKVARPKRAVVKAE
jgi:hypothetical protein